MMASFKKSTFLLLIVLTLTGAYAQDGWLWADSGMRFKFHEKNEKGQKPEIGDLASLHMIIKGDDGTEIKNSYKTGKPILFPVRVSSFPGDIYEAVNMMATGDSASFLLDTDSMYTYIFKKPLPANLDPTGDLLCTIKLLEVQNQKKYLEELAKKDSLKMMAHQEEFMARYKEEQQKIKAYIAKKGYTDVTTTESGLHIKKTMTTDGIKPEPHKTALIHYTVWLLDGKKIESTDDIGKPFAFNIDEHMIIEGWEEGVKNMRVGEKAYLIIPSHLAYREKSIGGKIPPHSILVIYVELLSVR